MNENLRKDADIIIRKAIHRVLPDEAVRNALKNIEFGNGRVYVAAIGKAAWLMAKTSEEIPGDNNI